jgi:CheY-like chemotaxis protein
MRPVLLVEDDPMQADLLIESLATQLQVETDVISTELEFQSRFEEIAKDPPRVVVMDVMLRWADPQPETPPPPRAQTFHRGGVRCLRMLQQDERTKSIPAIVFTILEERDLLQDMRDMAVTAEYIPKSIHGEAIVKRIQSALSRPRQG